MNAGPLGRDQFLAAVRRLPAAELDRVVSTDDTCGLLLRMAGKSLKPADLEFLSQVAIRFVCAELDWAKCWVGIPSSPEKLRDLYRDFWLCAASRHVQERGPWKGAMALHAAWDSFVGRGPWRAWRDDAEPPPSASHLETALFWATRWSRGNVLGEQQVYRIVQHEFERKCR